MYDPLLHVGSAAATLALPDRMAALRAWEESWNALAGGHDGDGGVFWQERRPDLRIALLPSLSSSSAAAAARVRHIVATVIDPEPSVGPEQNEDGLYDTGINDSFSFEPWFIAVKHIGFNARASYSYLDLRGCLGGVGGVGRGGGAPGGIQSGEMENGDRDGDRSADYDRAHWTVIKVPVRNVVAIALSAELDLAVVISCVFPFQICLTCLSFFLLWDQK